MTQGSRLGRWKYVAGSMLAVIGLLAIGALTQRDRIARWYYVGKFDSASDRSALVNTLAEMGEAVVPDLLPKWQQDDADLCAATGQVFAKLVADWGPTDPRSVTLAGEWIGVFPRCSSAGQQTILTLLPSMRNCGEPRIVDGCRGVAETAMKSTDVETRIQGVRIAMWSELNLLGQILPLLSDPVAEVRRSAMLALGPREGAGSEVVSTEELLHWLHDSDVEVRRMCEMSLRTRGLREEDIRMGRRITDPDPRERLALLVDLGSEDSVDPTSWLDRLSHDPVSAVRASAARVAVERRVEFGTRLNEMSESDPDGTVRAIARYYKQLGDRPRR